MEDGYKSTHQLQCIRTFGQCIYETNSGTRFESIVMEWMDDTIVSNVDPKQFVGLDDKCKTDAPVEMKL